MGCPATVTVPVRRGGPLTNRATDRLMLLLPTPAAPLAMAIHGGSVVTLQAQPGLVSIRTVNVPPVPFTWPLVAESVYEHAAASTSLSTRPDRWTM